VTRPADSSYSEDWRRIARRDWSRIQLALSADDVALAAFSLQQSVEKYLKAFLLSHGWKLRRIHELDALLEAACAYRSDLDCFSDLCERVSGYYMAERYPLADEPDLLPSEVRADVLKSRELIVALYPDEILN